MAEAFEAFDDNCCNCADNQNNQGVFAFVDFRTHAFSLPKTPPKQVYRVARVIAYTYVPGNPYDGTVEVTVNVNPVTGVMVFYGKRFTPDDPSVPCGPSWSTLDTFNYLSGLGTVEYTANSIIFHIPGSPDVTWCQLESEYYLNTLRGEAELLFELLRDMASIPEAPAPYKWMIRQLSYDRTGANDDNLFFNDQSNPTVVPFNPDVVIDEGPLLGGPIGTGTAGVYYSYDADPSGLQIPIGVSSPQMEWAIGESWLYHLNPNQQVCLSEFYQNFATNPTSRVGNRSSYLNAGPDGILKVTAAEAYPDANLGAHEYITNGLVIFNSVRRPSLGCVPQGGAGGCKVLGVDPPQEC
jgi:hypothetical protein